MTGLPAMATVLFTDLVGSTALRVALGVERADELRRVHDQLLGERVLAQDGRVVKGGGDGLLATFTSASAALTATVEMQQAIAAYNRRKDRIAALSVRIGLSAGDVLWEDGDCFGTPVVEAARLEAYPDGAQILCSDLVRLMALGMLAFTTGDLGRADDHLQAARSQCEAMGALTYEAHTRYWSARVSAARGDALSARLEASKAFELASQIGMTALTGRLTASGLVDVPAAPERGALPR